MQNLKIIERKYNLSYNQKSQYDEFKIPPDREICEKH